MTRYDAPLLHQLLASHLPSLLVRSRNYRNRRHLQLHPQTSQRWFGKTLKIVTRNGKNCT